MFGCLPFSQKIRKFRFKVKWKGNFPKNLFGNNNYGQPPEVVLFFRSERNWRNALTERFPFTKKFRKFRLGCKWNTFFGSFHWRISGINGTSEKVVLFSRLKLSDGNVCSIYNF